MDNEDRPCVWRRGRDRNVRNWFVHNCTLTGSEWTASLRPIRCKDNRGRPNLVYDYVIYTPDGVKVESRLLERGFVPDHKSRVEEALRDHDAGRVEPITLRRL